MPPTQPSINPVNGINFIGAADLADGAKLSGSLMTPGELGFVSIFEKNASVTKWVTADANGNFSIILSPKELARFSPGALTATVNALGNGASAHGHHHHPYNIIGTASETLSYAPHFGLASSTADGIAGDNWSFQNDTYWGQHVGGELSSSGNLVAFVSSATNLSGSSGLYQVYVKNMQSGAVNVVSADSDGALANLDAMDASLSADGVKVAFSSIATNFGVTSDYWEVYIKDTISGAINIASSDAGGVPANADSIGASLSSDGTEIAFSSAATNLGVSSGSAEVYVKNASSGVLSLASANSNGLAANGNSTSASLSANGLKVAFLSSATNLGVASGLSEAYVKDLSTDAIQVASSSSRGVSANSAVSSLVLSQDGTKVVFVSDASNLIAGAPNSSLGSQEVYIKDLNTGLLQLVSTDRNGNAASLQGGEASFSGVSISADGRYVAFSGDADNLVRGGGAGTYLKDLKTGAIVEIGSVGNDGVAGQIPPSFSADGTHISITQLDSNSHSQVYVIGVQEALKHNGQIFIG